MAKSVKTLADTVYSAVLIAQRNIKRIAKLEVIDNDIDINKQHGFMECECIDRENIVICIEFIQEEEGYFNLENRGYSIDEDNNIELYQDFYIICIPKIGDNKYWILTRDEMLKTLQDTSTKEALYGVLKGEQINENLSLFMKDEYYNNWNKLTI